MSSIKSNASGIIPRKTKAMNIGKLHVRLANIGRSETKLPAHMSYSKTLEKPGTKDTIRIPDYHNQIKHRLDSVLHPKRVFLSFYLNL
jgi:hypothetical protein